LNTRAYPHFTLIVFISRDFFVRS